MLRADGGGLDAVRFATADELEGYLAGAAMVRTAVTQEAAREEQLFLGLRLNRGVDASLLDSACGIKERALLEEAGLVERSEGRARLTTRGRLLSNEVFQRFLKTETVS